MSAFVHSLTTGAMLMLLVALPGQAQSPRLIIQVDDVIAYPGQQNVVIPIYMDNYLDSVAGFQLWLQMDRPDIAVFQTGTDTVVDTSYWNCLQYSGPDCIDSVLTTPEGTWDFFHIDTNMVSQGSIDTTGTLCSGWEFLDARSLSGLGYDLQITGLADPLEPPITPAIAPQMGGVLINVLADVYNIPDSMTERTVTILAIADCFARPDGQCIQNLDSVPDTNCYICTQWIDTICLNWQIASMPPCDSIGIDTIVVLDSLTVIVIPGSITVTGPPPICGDINGDGMGPDVGDLTYLIAYLFQGGPSPPRVDAADVDSSHFVDVADLTWLVAYLFQGGPPPTC
ncbi:MAG: hypothetical protein ABII79_14275 [bacterium]